MSRRFFGELAKQMARSEFFSVSGSREQLAKAIRTRSLPKGAEVQRLRAEQTERYCRAEHWNSQPHCLVFKGDPRKAEPIEGLGGDVCVLTAEADIELCLLQTEYGSNRTVFKPEFDMPDIPSSKGPK